MKIENRHLGFVGFGHMGQIICLALERARLIPRSQILFHRRDPDKAKKCQEAFGISATSLETLLDRSDILLLCVRPSQMGAVLEDLTRCNPVEKMFISIAAGVKISFLQNHLGAKAQIARAMPNIASSVGEGMSLLSFTSGASIELRSAAGLLFGAMGETLEIGEAQMDIGCAMAGSGPAFVLEMIEAMARQGEKEGLSYAQSLTIAAQTFLGAAELVRRGGIPQDLLHQIATPGGTTQAGLDVLRREEGGRRFADAVLAATRRSCQISTQYN